MKKICLYLLCVWVMFNNGEICKFPQAGQWKLQRIKGHEYLRLENAETEELVVALHNSTISKIGFSLDEIRKQGYYIYRNPRVTGYSEDIDVIQVGHMRRLRDDTGKTYEGPATILKPNFYSDYKLLN